MKRRIAVIAILLCMGIVCGVSLTGNQTYAQTRTATATPAMPQITVYNPMGTPPPVTLQPQAPRLNTLDGKTVYFLNTGYIGTDRLMAVMMDWFKANYPKTNVVYRDASNGVSLSALNDAMWAELTEKGDAAIVGLGH
ncbi:MAG: hypothetical protein LBJ21_04445 [Acidobacteriota bacterium]|jgi:hypothetical protein|nr:hypothetical protein [Acidobacteriota bacterium]